MDLEQKDAKDVRSRAKESEDPGEAEWTQNGKGYVCSNCGSHASKKLAFCPNHNCDRWMTNHA
jgi:lipopolysaccharide biosynthesis regulator YciM